VHSSDSLTLEEKAYYTDVFTNLKMFFLVRVFVIFILCFIFGFALVMFSVIYGYQNWETNDPVISKKLIKYLSSKARSYNPKKVGDI